MMLSLLLTFGMIAAANPPMPVILDTDIGDDIDDTWALAMLLGTPQLDLKLIVTATDHTPTKTRLVAKILERCGRTDIPIGTGVATTEKAINQQAWLGDYALADYKGVVHTDGVQAMIDMIHDSPTPITLLVIGPETNIQEAIKRAPDIAQKARIVSMAGSVYVGYQGKDGRDPEYNIFRDIPAARAVFDAPFDITWAPLDTCGTIVLKGDLFAAVEQSKTPRAQVVMENYKEWVNYKNYPKGESSVLFDTLAIYLAYDDSLCEMETVKLSIDDKGATVPDEKGRPVKCALKWKDRDAYEALLMKALTE